MQKRQEACLDCIKRCLESHGKKRLHSPAPSTPLCFFKIMIGNFGEALFLPPLVTRGLSGLLDENVDIEDSNGHCWRVKVSFLDNSLAFKQGWNDFVSDHSVKIGELLVLNRKSRSCFSVKIFATTGCERLEFGERNKAGVRKRKNKIGITPKDFSLQKIDDESEGSVKKKRPTKAATSDPSVPKSISGNPVVEFRIEDMNTLQAPFVNENGIGTPQTTDIKSDALEACQVDENAVTCIESDSMNKKDVPMLTIDNGICLSDTNDAGGSQSILPTEMSKDLVIEEQKTCFHHTEDSVTYPFQNSVQMKVVIKVPSANLLTSQDFGKSSNAPEADSLVQNDKISPNNLACTVSSQTLSRSECNGCQRQDETEDLAVIVHPFVGERVFAQNFLLESNTDKDLKLKQGEIKLDSLDLSDCEMKLKKQNAEEIPGNTVSRLEGTNSRCGGDTEGKLSEHEGVAYNFDDELQGICYIVMVKFSDKLRDTMLKPISLCDTSRDNIICQTDKEDTTGIISSASDHSLDVHGNKGGSGIHIASSSATNINSSTEAKLCSSGNFQVSQNDGKAMDSSSYLSEKLPDLEHDEKLTPCPGVVLGSVNSECVDPTDLPSPNSLKFEFSIPENAKSCIELPDSLPCTLFTKFSGRKVIMLQDPLMRTWPVLYCDSETFVGFLGGWEIFAAANNLKQGDTCELFDIATGLETTLGVRISQVWNPS